MNFSDHVLKMGNHVAIIEERLDECDTYDPTHLNAENIVHENKQAAENDNENHSSFKSIDQIQDLAESEDQSENHKHINGYVSSPDPHSHEGVMDRKDTSTAQHNLPIASMKDQSISTSDDNLLQVGIPISEMEGNLMESERNCILKPNNHNVNSSTTTTSELESPMVRDSSSNNGEIHRAKSKAQYGGSGRENIHISPLSRHLEKANDKQKGSSVKLKCDSKSDGTFSKPLPKEMAMPEAKDAALQNAEASNTPVIVSNDSKYSKVNANHINDDALIQPVKHKSSSFMKASEIPACTSKKKLKSNLMTKQIEVDIVQKKLDSPDKNGRIVLKQVTQDDRGSLKKNKLSICNSSQVNDLTPEKSYHKNVPSSILGNKPNIHKPRISVLVNGTDNRKSCTDGATGPHQEYKHRAVLEKKRKDVCRSLKSLPAEGKKLNEKRINSIISQVISSGSGPIQLNCLNSNKVSNTDADPSASLDNMHVIPSKDNDTTKAVTSVKVPEKAKLGVKKSKMFLPRDNGYSKNRACNEQSFQTEMVHKSKKPSVISKSGSVVISKKRFGIKKPNTSSLLARKGENGNRISLSESNHHHHPCQIKFKKKLSSNVKKNQSHVIGLKETPSALSKQHNSSHTSHTSEIKNKVENNDVIAPTLNGMFPNSDENPDESTSAHIQRKCEQPLSHEPESKTALKCQSRENEICRTLRVSEIRNTKDNKISLTLSRCVSSPNQHKKANYSIVPKVTSPSTQARKTISKHQGHTNHENYSTKASEVRNRGNEDEDSFHGIDNNSTKTLPKSTSVEQKGRHMAIQEESSLKTQNLNGNICTLSSVESKNNEKVYMPASSDSGLTKGKPGLNTLQKKLKKSLSIYIDSVKQNQGCSGQNLVLQNKDIQDGNNCMISSRHGSVSRDITSNNKVPVNVTRKRPSVSTAEQMQPSLLEAQDSIKKSFSQLPQEKRRTKKKICNVSPNNERCATKNAPALSNIQDMPKYTTDSVQKQKDCHDSNFSYESMQKSKNFELIIMPINPDNNSSVNRAKEGLNMIINKKSSGQPKYTISNPLGKNVSNPPSSHAHLYESSSEKPHRAKKWDKHDSDIHKPTSTNKVKPDIHVEKSNKHSFDCRTCSTHTDKPKVVVEKTPYSYLGLTEVSAFKDSDDDDEDSDCAVDTAESSTNLSMEHEVVKRRKRFRTSCSEVVVRGSKVQRQSEEEESNDETDRSQNSDEGIEELEEPTRLADIPCIASEIHESPDELLQTLHGILFGTSGVCHNKATLQKMIRNILNFSGFPFIEGSESYNSKLKRLKRLHFQFLSEIESILFGSCIVSRSDAAEKILHFLMHPTRTEAECLRKTKACKLKPEDLEQYERLKREILESDGTFPIVLVKKMKVDEIERYLYPEANDLAVETDLSNSSCDNSPEMSSGNLTAGIGSISEDPDFIPMPSPRKSYGPRQATNGPRQATNGTRQATNGIHTKGRLLKSFAEIAASIANADQKILSLLHVLLFGNDGDLGTRRQHILEFSGFSSSHQNYDMKNRKRFLRLISSSDLKSVCKILHLSFPNQEKDSMIRGLLQFIRAPCEANLTLQPRIRGPEKASKRKAPSPLPFTKPSTRSENAKKPLSRNGSSSTSFSDASFSPVSAASASSESNMSMGSTYQNSRNEVSSRESLSINTASASSSAPKVNVSSGKPLESFETIRFNIECATPDDLTELYDILFVKPCDNFEIHQKILQFRGFDFNQDSTEFHFRKTLLSYMNFESLKKIAKFLNLLDDYTFMHKGELENRIMKFFVDLKDMKQGSYSSSPGKRTHIVRLSEQTNSLLTIHEVSQPSTSSGSSSQGDTQPLKIKEDLSPMFSSCSLSESHPLVGRLKADLSSSSEDEIESTTPLITFANHPSDTRLRKDIREILYFKNFNITMKELIAMVFAKYPKYDLRYRSNFIKSKARHILSNLHRQ